MLPKTLNTQKDNAAKLKVANCPLEICRLRIVMESGAEECLMESVRSMWSDPNAENYCSDPSCRKFVGHFQTKFVSHFLRK
jgi:hypothetical protein